MRGRPRHPQARDVDTGLLGALLPLRGDTDYRPHKGGGKANRPISAWEIPQMVVVRGQGADDR
jgi:hypothetical protein